MVGASEAVAVVIKATVTIWIRASGPLDGEEMDDIAASILDRVDLFDEVFDSYIVRTELA